MAELLAIGTAPIRINPDTSRGPPLALCYVATSECTWKARSDLTALYDKFMIMLSLEHPRIQLNSLATPLAIPNAPW